METKASLGDQWRFSNMMALNTAVENNLYCKNIKYLKRKFQVNTKVYVLVTCFHGN